MIKWSPSCIGTHIKSMDEIDEKWYRHKPEKVIGNVQVKILRIVEATRLHRRLQRNKKMSSLTWRFLVTIILRKLINSRNTPTSELMLSECVSFRSLLSQLSLALESIQSDLKSYSDEIGIKPCIPSIQKSTLLDTANIL